MTTLNRGSAEIIAFPLRGRFAAVASDDVDAPRAALRAAKAVSFGSWYHEEAIREERNLTN